jgi:adenylate cyclase
MAIVVDPVCGMRIDAADAVAMIEHEGQTYYFCSEACRVGWMQTLSLMGGGETATDSPVLTESEVADRANIDIQRLRHLVGLGILQPEDGRFPARDVMRARVVAALEAKGIDADALAAALASGNLTLGYLESAGRRFPRSHRTFTEVSQELQVSFEILARLYVAFGLRRPEPNERVREEDLPIIQGLPVLVRAGLGEGDVLRMVRIWGESVRRIAQFQTHYFHAKIEEPFRRRGLGDNEAYEAAIREVGVRMGHTGEEVLAWLYGRHSEVFIAEHQFGHVEAALEEAGIRPRPPQVIEAAAFADLTGYTTLTEEAGDEVAATVALTLAEYVSEVGARHRGQVVKMLGDGVHFHFPDPGDAVRASLEIVEGVRPRRLPPAHIGVNAGPMIYDEGDYFGRTVNIAARIASQAGAGQVFVGEDLVRTVTPQGFRVVEVGDFDLKGIARPVKLFQALKDEAA